MHGGLACYGSWGCKESDMTERLNSTELNWFFFKFFSHLGYYKALSRVPCAVQFKYLLVIYFKYSSVYMSIPNSQSILHISLFCVKFLFKSLAFFLSLICRDSFIYSGYKYFFRYLCWKYFLVILWISHRKNTWKVWRRVVSKDSGASLVVQWLRVHQPMQGTQVQSLVQEDPTCCWSVKLVLHDWAHVP